MVSTRSILIVEEQAHVLLGHYPVMFAELAEALVQRGCAVTVLTCRGWSLRNQYEPVSFNVRQLGEVASGVYQLGTAIRSLRWGPAPRVASRVLHDIAMTVSARRLSRRLKAEMIFVSMLPRPYMVALLAGPGRSLVYEFSKYGSGAAAWSDAMARSALGWVEQRRRRRGGGLALAMNNPTTAETWRSAELPFEIAVLPFTGSRPTKLMPESRARLGLDPSARVALMFGADHPGKDPITAWEAFAQLEERNELSEWHLVVAGHLADRFLSWRAERGAPLHRASAFGGYVTDEQRAMLHCAADTLLLSFREGWAGDSATLTNGITWGLPMICSDRCQPADTVRNFGLGLIIEPGSVPALITALTAIPTVLPEDALSMARATLSMTVVADMHLDALDSIGAPR